MYRILAFDQFQGAFLNTCFPSRELALFQQVVDDAGSVDGKKQDLEVAKSAKDDSVTVPLQQHPLELPIDCKDDVEMFPASPHHSNVMPYARGVMYRPFWYSKISRICNFDMFRNFVKISNSISDVALSLRLLFSLFLRNWQVLRQQRARLSKNIGHPPQQKPETAKTPENRLFYGC